MENSAYSWFLQYPLLNFFSAMSVAHTLEEVRSYWNEYVNDIEITQHPRGSPEFFEALEKYRYDKIKC